MVSKKTQCELCDGFVSITNRCDICAVEMCKSCTSSYLEGTVCVVCEEDDECEECGLEREDCKCYLDECW